MARFHWRQVASGFGLILSALYFIGSCLKNLDSGAQFCGVILTCVFAYLILNHNSPEESQEQEKDSAWW